MTIENPIIYNILVDHINVDLIGVADDRHEGKELFRRSAKHVYLKNGDFMQKSGKTEAYFPYRVPNRAIYEGRNIDYSIQTVKRRNADIRGEYEGKKQLRDLTDNEIKAIRERAKAQELEIVKLAREKRNIESRKKEAENIQIKEPENILELEDNLKEVVEHVEAEERELREKEQLERQQQEQIQIHQENYQVYTTQKLDKEKEIKELIDNLKEKRNELDELNAERLSIGDKRKELMNKNREDNSKLFEEQTRYEEMKEELENDIEIQSLTEEEFRRLQRTIRSLETIEYDRKKLERKQERLNVNKIDYDEVEKEFERKEQQLESTEHRLQQLVEIQTKLEEQLLERTRKYNAILKKTSQKTMELFDAYLRKKPGCKGKIKLNHKERTLDVEVSIDNQNERSVGSLSGGERSFSTVCLLLSLWNVVDCPFRAMDEFDVYMDSMARKIAIETLMETTQSLNKRQYIFITPHNLDGVKSSESVKVFKIKRPERDTQR